MKKKCDIIKKTVNLCLPLICLILTVIILIHSIIEVEFNLIKIESILLTITFSLDFAINIFFIIKIRKLTIENAELVNVCKANNINVDNVKELKVGTLLAESLSNNDDEIMQKVINYMDDFETSVRNGYFSLDTFFPLDILLKPEILRRSIDNASFLCKDEKLNNYLQNLKIELQNFANITMIHSFPIQTPGFNKMRWISIQEEIELNQYNATDAKIKEEKEAYENGKESLSKIIQIYNEMVSYWKKNSLQFSVSTK